MDHCCLDHCCLDHNWPTAGGCVLLLCVAGCFRHVYVFNVFLKQYVCYLGLRLVSYLGGMIFSRVAV